MAKNPHFLHDINVYQTSPAYLEALNNPALAGILAEKSAQLVRLYQARVGKKTGKLMQSADSTVRVGGQNNDRLIGVTTASDASVVSTWNPRRRKTGKTRKNGKPYGPLPSGKFYYGEFHEEGNIGKGRSTKTVNGRKGYHELRETAIMWRSWFD